MRKWHVNNGALKYNYSYVRIHLSYTKLVYEDQEKAITDQAIGY